MVGLQFFSQLAFRFILFRIKAELPETIYFIIDDIEQVLPDAQTDGLGREQKHKAAIK
jgi:hypothetical protein